MVAFITLFFPFSYYVVAVSLVQATPPPPSPFSLHLSSRRKGQNQGHEKRDPPSPLQVIKKQSRNGAQFRKVRVRISKPQETQNRLGGGMRVEPRGHGLGSGGDSTTAQPSRTNKLGPFTWSQTIGKRPDMSRLLCGAVQKECSRLQKTGHTTTYVVVHDYSPCLLLGPAEGPGV